jgi:hypothetical protein
MDTETEVQIQNDWAVFNEDVRVPGSAVDDSGPVAGWFELGKDCFVDGSVVERCV